MCRERTRFGASLFQMKIFWSKCTAFEKKIAPFCRHLRARSDSAPGIVVPRYAPGVTLRDKVHSCEIRRALNVELLPNRAIAASLVRPCVPECPVKDRRGESCWLNPRESVSYVAQGPSGVAASLTLLGPVLVWRQQDYQRLLLTVRNFKSSCGCCPRDPP